MADDETTEPTPEADEPQATPEASEPAATPEAAEPEAAEAETGAAPQPAEAAGEPADAEDDAPEAPSAGSGSAIPGADLEVDIVLDGEKRAGGDDEFGYYDASDDASGSDTPGEDDDSAADTPIVDVSIDLSADARYIATGKRKSAVARVILKPGTGQYSVNGKDLDVYFPRDALLRTIRQALEVVGYHEQLDVVARIHGGGVSSQAGALRHGISRALIVAQPGLRGELKKRGFLTRDSRVKERKKAGLKKARKRPQFSKR